MENVIQLKKRNTLKFKIQTDEEIDTGEYLEFDFDTIDYALKLQECDIQHKKNISWIKDQLAIIRKKEDHKGKYLLSYKKEEEIKAVKEFYLKEMDALDLFLGKNGTRKMLNGKDPYIEMYQDIMDSLEPIMPIIEKHTKNIADRIKEKYSFKKEDNILE